MRKNQRAVAGEWDKENNIVPMLRVGMPFWTLCVLS